MFLPEKRQGSNSQPQSASLHRNFNPVLDEELENENMLEAQPMGKNYLQFN